MLPLLGIDRPGGPTELSAALGGYINGVKLGKTGQARVSRRTQRPGNGVTATTTRARPVGPS